ncbi:MAG: 7-cyano-7-deazaguanine synthase QueC [Gammaproteobacteria bacterium]|nr:MAG: 7-cyano-7-deazaguanine synthase QueC [Gammaproteobacteria bacterium]
MPVAIERGRAVVLLSGGMDSATCLALAARREHHRCHALSFDYGQRHRAELDAAVRVAGLLGACEHRCLRIDLGALGGSALTDPGIAVPRHPVVGIPVTYVPARNTVFLSFALAWAEVLDADFIYTGVNAVDFSGYPDCRPEYVAAFQAMANLATRRGVDGRPVEIRAPLIALGKADIIRLGHDLGVDFAATVSCYQADAGGAACGACDACRLRRAGFEAAGMADVTRYQAGSPAG